MRMNHVDRDTLKAALIGYEAQKDSIEAKIAEIRPQLGGRATVAADGPKPMATQTKRGMSAAARTRIAAAQRKRWAAYRKSKAK